MENTITNLTASAPEYYDQKHVHELLGSTFVAGGCNECHNHRFATVTGEAMREGRSHVHEVKFTTDTSDKHYHEFMGKTGPAIYVGEGKHVHFLKECTKSRDGHKHLFQAATLIDAPTDEEHEYEHEHDCNCGCGC